MVQPPQPSETRAHATQMDSTNIHGALQHFYLQQQPGGGWNHHEMYPRNIVNTALLFISSGEYNDDCHGHHCISAGKCNRGNSVGGDQAAWLLCDASRCSCPLSCKWHGLAYQKWWTKPVWNKELIVHCELLVPKKSSDWPIQGTITWFHIITNEKWDCHLLQDS